MTVTIDPNPVREFIDANPETTLETLHEQFPSVDQWTLKTHLCDARRQAALAQITKDDDALSAPIEGISKAALRALRSGFFRPITVKLRGPRPVKPIYKTDGRKTLILPDIHAPEHDATAIDSAIQVGQAVGVDRVILNGDFFDVHSLSKYTPHADRPFRWVEERALAVPVIAGIREQFPDIPVDAIFGNHDVRPFKFIASHAPQLQGLFTLPQMLGIDGLGFNYPVDNRLLLANGQLLVIHGTTVRGEAGVSVQAEVKKSGLSTIMGHVHRLALYGVTRTVQVVNWQQPLIGVESGALCSLKPSYMEVEETANWQQGAVIVTEFAGGLYDVELIRIVDGCAMFRGHQFESRVVR